MVTPLGWLERVPTYKEALENVKDKDLQLRGSRIRFCRPAEHR